jgi:hypothetical protein
MMRDQPDDDEQDKPHRDGEKNSHSALADESLGGALVEVVLIVCDRHEYAAGRHASKYPSVATSDVGRSPSGGWAGRAGRAKSAH